MNVTWKDNASMFSADCRIKKYERVNKFINILNYIYKTRVVSLTIFAHRRTFIQISF